MVLPSQKILAKRKHSWEVDHQREDEVRRLTSTPGGQIAMTSLPALVTLTVFLLGSLLSIADASSLQYYQVNILRLIPFWCTKTLCVQKPNTLRSLPELLMGYL